MPRDRRSQTAPERTEEQRERAREEREKRRLAKQGAATPPLPPPATLPAAAAAEAEAAIPTPAPAPSALTPTPAPAPSALTPTPAPAPSALTPTPVPAATPAPTPVPAVTPVPTPAAPPEEPAPQLPPDLEPQPIQEQPRASEPERESYAVPPSVLQQRERPGRLHRPHAHRPHLHRPHLHQSHRQRPRSRAARLGVLLAFGAVLAALVAAVLLLTRHSSEPPKPPPPPPVAKVVIPEGYTRSQIAALAHAGGLTGSYLLASKSSRLLRPSDYGAPSDTPNLEGFLFPASYELYARTPATGLVSQQLAAFKENFGGGEVHRAKVLGVTPYELLIVASMIEREAELPHDRSRVAAVIYNRLRLNMALGIDSTLRYALKDFTHPLTEAELHSDSPYNTRVHTGLPPTPISNPGVAAIKAAARPAHVSYLYYVAGADGCGELVFSTSYAQFEKNAAAYNDAISSNGGRVPACKRK